MNNAGSLNSQLIELLDDFGVRSVTDYYALAPGEQPYFVKRLYKTLVRGLDQTVRAAKSDEGVKFHFQTSGSLARSPNVPTATFLKKLSFYANRTIVSFPFRELTREEQAHLIHSRNKGERDSLFYFGDFTTHRTSRGGRVQKLGKLYTVDTQAFRDLLTVITRLRPAMEADVSCVVSTFPDNKNVLRNRRLGLTSANFKQRELERQFWEESSVRADEERTPTALSHLLLPHFAEVPFERILEIRAKEADLYEDFQQRFSRVLKEPGRTDSETRILEFLRDVDDGVRILERRFAEISAAYRRKNIALTIKFLAAGMVWMTPVDPDVKHTVTALIGSLSTFDYLTAREEVVAEKAKLRSERFYVPWSVFAHA